MKSIGDSIIKKYAEIISYNPVKVLIIMFLITIIAITQAANVNTKSMDNEDTIPDSFQVKEAFDIIGNDFGGRDTMMISIEIDPRHPEGINDLRKPEIIEYINTLTLLTSELRDIEEVNSLSSHLRMDNEGRLPKTKPKIEELISNNRRYLNYISEDFKHSVIRLDLKSGFDDEEIVDDIQNIIDNILMPAHLKVSPAGNIAAGPVIEEELGPDMQNTSRFSIIGIIIVLLILFGSVRYAFIPLTVIIAGIIWAYGFFGFIGVEISPATTGAMSMIMGIGIDFGIQTIKRYRQEILSKEPSKAMAETLYKVISPMFIATLCAIIGFSAMSMGDLTIMQELGTLMSYGVGACFLAAITIVPAISVISEKIKIKYKTNGKEGKNNEKKN